MGTGNFEYGPTDTAWTYSGGGGIAGNGSGFTSGNPDAPEGTQVGFLQGGGSFSQVVAGMAAGIYGITFDAAQRANWQASVQDFQVLVDGNVVGTFTPSGIAYLGYSTPAFTVAAGSHTIAFQSLDSAGGDNTAFIDDIAQVHVASAVLADAGFEAPSVGTGNFEYGPTDSAWTYGGGGVAGNGSGFTSGNPDAPEGTQVGFLQWTGSFSQVVTGMAAATYEITFDAAQRANWQASIQDFQVLVDGTVVGTFTPAGTSYAPYTTDAFSVAAGSHTIAFQALDSAGGDNTAFVDDVQFTTLTTTATVHLYYSAEGQVIEEREGGTADADVSHQYVWSEAYVNALVLRDDYQDDVLVPADRLYAQQDANYDTTALVNTSGTVVERYTYSPYGVVTVLNASGSPVSGNTSVYGWQYLFQGGRVDSVTGDVQFGARDYDPTTGVWTQVDPLGLGAGDLNDYRFVGGNPVDATDPSGLFRSGISVFGYDVGQSVSAYASGVLNVAGAEIVGAAEALQEGLNIVADGVRLGLQTAKNVAGTGGEVQYRSNLIKGALETYDTGNLSGNGRDEALADYTANAMVDVLSVGAKPLYEAAKDSYDKNDPIPLAKAAGAIEGGVIVGKVVSGVVGVHAPNRMRPAGSGVGGAGGQLTPNACGMACGQRLLGQQGIEVFQSNLSRGFYKGLEPAALAENLNRFQPGWKGFYAYPTAEDIAGLSTRGPYIARTGGNSGHFVIVESVENGLVKLWDPAGGVARSQALSDFVDIVSGVVFK